MLGKLLKGRYQVLQVLGGGGFGQTYIAQDIHRPGHPKCVVKHLRPNNRNPDLLETARRLFNSEAETLERLGQHDQIPRLLAYFEENQEFFLVQEFIEGYTLKEELLNNSPWTENKVIDLLQQVLGILEFIHGQQVIHRDIKPSNIIRRRQDGNLVLIDFGAVKQIHTQLLNIPEASGITVAIGTVGYMSTEQGRGKPRPNSDIYSLGIIAIEALTGVPPNQFEEDSDTGEIIFEHCAVVSPGLSRVLNKMLRHHFKERYQTATEALQALKLACNVSTSGEPSSSILSPEQYDRLSAFLVDTVGPVAPTLLRRVAASALNSKEVIDNLAVHLNIQQQTEFKQKATSLLESVTSKQEVKKETPLPEKPSSNPEKVNLIQTKDTAITPTFLRQCERDLAAIIGPIASFLIQKALKSTPQISREEFVKILASEISDTQEALKFQERLMP